MHISGTFLNSKVARRLAVLLFLAAAVPTILLTKLTDQKINQLVYNYEHQSLLNETKMRALAVFTNITFARSSVKNLGAETQQVDKNTAKNLLLTFASGNVQIFSSIAEISESGTILEGAARSFFSKADLQQIKNTQSQRVELRVLQNSNNSKPSVNLIYRKNHSKAPASYLIAEISPQFLWGSLEDYPLGLNVCAYQVNQNSKMKVFCSNEDGVIDANLKPSKLNQAEWELFLRGEFNAKPWLFTVNRLTPITQTHLQELIGGKPYISIALLSLLIVGLLSLNQIRKTMVPLEALIKGTKKIASGHFDQIKVDGSSEFTELANAFNGMSSHIKSQLSTLQSFSNIDKEIVSNINVEQIANLVAKRLQTLEPDAIFCIAHLEETSTSELQCNCFITGHAALSSIRLSISAAEIKAITSDYEGNITQTSLTSTLVNERLMAELGAKEIWRLPIFWQGEICAFLVVGGKDKLDINNLHLSEFRELASRIGIVISSQAREQKLLLEAQYDSLTGLPNRILLRDRLQLAMKHSDHTSKPMWVVFIDLDRFKVVNDSMGHTTGDALLVEIGSRLLAETRETDTVARFGGDEFVIALSGDAGENIQLSVLNRIMDSIAEPVLVNSHELINTCSIGISVYPNDGKNAEALIKNADIAMYRAKELGRNNYQFFTQSLNEKAAERMQMISLMHKAIENDEFELNYQPKVDLHSNKIVGLEALIRWNNATLGNVPPAIFIPLAEESGLIAAIGAWVLQTACKQMVVWQKSGLGNLLISVNVSAKQFQQDGLIEKIKSTLVETGLQAKYLELELTESALMDNANIINDLHAIKALGIQLSIDDFGTGYSSLSYLDTLPIDSLKIDKSFTDTLTLSTKESPITNTILSLAKNLGLKTVAEGVETAEQVEYLRKHGCDQIQGYFFSKPVNAKEIRAMLVSGKQLMLPDAPNQLKLIKTASKNTQNKH